MAVPYVVEAPLFDRAPLRVDATKFVNVPRDA
jgi:hypothetical protein